MNRSLMSRTKGSRKGSKERGLFFGSKYEGTKPTTYTSSVQHLFTLDMVAMETPIAPVITINQHQGQRWKSTSCKSQTGRTIIIIQCIFLFLSLAKSPPGDLQIT